MPLLASLTVALTLVAPSQTPDVGELVAAGEAAWREARWDDASDAFAKAYAATHEPAYLYARAQIERMAGRCPQAVPLYRDYLATEPSENARAAVLGHIAECEPEPAPQRPPPPVVAPPPATTREVAPAPRRPWYRDPWGGSLVGVGVAGALAGGILVGLAYRGARDAEEASTDAAFGEAYGRAQTLEHSGAIVLGLGGALIVAGVIRWAVVGAKQRRQRSWTSRLDHPSMSMLGCATPSAPRR